MRSDAEHRTVLALIAEGLNDCEVSRRTGVPRATVRGWRTGRQRRGQRGSAYDWQGLHERKIRLVDWQQEIVNDHPRAFLRGLVESDGSRFTNRVRVGGRSYAYPRYTFSNESADIRGLFTDTCDRLGIAWRQMNAANVSVARREAVAAMDTFIGPKR